MIRNALKSLSIAAAATAFVIAAARFASSVKRNVVDASQALTAAMAQFSDIKYDDAQRQCVSAALAHAKG